MFDNTYQYGFFVTVNKNRVTEYLHSDGLIYLEGRKDTEYELELVNDSHERVTMIPSVDGLSVLDGKTAGLTSSGYIVEARSSVKIPGWTLDKSAVAKFVFNSAKESYTKRSGHGTKNVGALGVLVFREYITPVFSSAGFCSSTSDPFDLQTMNCSATLSGSLGTRSVDNDLNSVGTGFGDKATFNTQPVSFTKRDENHPDAMLILYYDSQRGLEKRGIQLEYKSKPMPSPFPKYSTSTDTGVGCVIPKGWEPIDRDKAIDKLLDTMKDGEDMDNMYEMLKHVENDKLDDAFKSYKDILKL